MYQVRFMFTTHYSLKEWHLQGWEERGFKSQEV
jgi:hypothetical protein